MEEQLRILRQACADAQHDINYHRQEENLARQRLDEANKRIQELTSKREA